MGFNSASSGSSTTVVTTSAKFEAGISFLNLSLPQGEGGLAKIGPCALRASEPIMQKLHNAFLSGDADKMAKAEAWIRANVVIAWRDATKIVKTDAKVYDFE